MDRLKILVTGASGFLGKAILAYLEQYDLSITAVCRKTSFKDLPVQSNLHKVITTDCLFSKDIEWWKDVLTDINIVIHCAWYVNPKDYLSSPENIKCLYGTLILAQACIDKKIKYFAGIGTCLEYDFANAENAITVETPLKPTSVYASAKVSSFNLLKSLFEESCVTFGWYRIFYLFGEHEKKGRLYPYLKERLYNNEVAILKNAHLIRDYINVDDAAEKISKNILSLKAGDFNVCSGIGITIKDFAITVAKKFNRLHLIKIEVNQSSVITPLKIVGVCNIKGIINEK